MRPFLYSLVLIGVLSGLTGCSDDSAGCLAGPGCAAPADASLAALSVWGGTLSPAFAPATLVYAVQVPFTVSTVQVAARATDPRATIRINDIQVDSGKASEPIEVGAEVTRIAVTVSVPGGVTQSYRVVATRPSIEYLKAGSVHANDLFGYSVSLSGDTLAVGVKDEASSATGVNGDPTNRSAPRSGAVYVFQRTGTSWAQQAYLKASNAEAGDQFGYSVSLSGDTLAVGANYEASSAVGVNGDQADNRAPFSGAVYIFQRTGISWAQQAYLKASNTDADDAFGSSVSLAGDTLAVGAPGESSKATGVNGDQSDNSAPLSGAVYIFQRTGTSWAQQAYLKASNTDAKDDFGISVSLAGDTLAVGADREASAATSIDGDQADNSEPLHGAVYVFQRTGTSWAQQAYVKSAGFPRESNFGVSTSLSDDTLAVGALGIDGAAYVFQRSGSSWAQQAYFSSTDDDDQFGLSVALAGDTLAVGAMLDPGIAAGINGNPSDIGAHNRGAVFMYQRASGSWVPSTYLKPSNSGDWFAFGYGLSLSGDTLAVGAFGESGSAPGVNGNQTAGGTPDSGAVYIFR